MPKPEKVERVAELKARIEGSDALLLTEYRGLTVSEITELRRSLDEGGASFAVVKNTLMRRAASAAGMSELEDLLSGPSAITFVDGDPVAAAKSVVKATKQFPALVLKGAYMDGKLLSADDAKALAELESREVMLSQDRRDAEERDEPGGGDVPGAASPSSCRCSRPTRRRCPATHRRRGRGRRRHPGRGRTGAGGPRGRSRARGGGRHHRGRARGSGLG